MASAQTSARLTGVFFVITFVGSIPALLLYDPVLKDPNYIVGAGADGRVLLGAVLEIVTAMANIATAVTLFPILKRQNEAVALGYVASRIVESTLIAVGILGLLSVVTLRQDYAVGGGDAASLVLAGKSLVALHDWTFLLGPGLLAGFGNGLLLGYLMFRSGLLPRPLAALGLVAGPLVFASGIGAMFGLYEQVSPVSLILTVPEIIWEGAILGIWLIVRGFSPSAIRAAHDRAIG